MKAIFITGGKQYLVSEKNGKLKPGKYEFSLITPNVVSYVYIIDKNNIERTKNIKVPLIKDTIILGELSLEGTLRPIHGCLSVALKAKEQGYKLAFERCLEKRDKEYERLARREFKSTIALKNKNKNIEYKFNTFLKSITK